MTLFDNDDIIIIGGNMNLLQLFISLGYTEDEYLQIRNHYAYKRIIDETLYNNVKRNHAWLIEKYGKQNVKKMVLRCPTIYGLSIENLEQKIKYLISLGYSYDDVIKITRNYPNIYGYNNDTIKKIIENIISLGYSYDDVKKMILISPSIIGYDIKTLKDKIDLFISLGYTKKDFIIMSSKYPFLFQYDKEKIINKIDYMLGLGYKKDDFINMTKIQPSLFSYTTDKIDKSIKLLLSWYSFEDVFKMTIDSPRLLCGNEDSLEIKLKLYDLLSMRELALKHSNYLMQGIDLSYARYCFLKENGVEVTMDNYSKLFSSDKTFTKQYGITNQELKEKYDVYEYLNEQNNSKKMS